MASLQKNLRSISGYKIKDTHFKIGSKIHVSDFYYAKRFFQNGFFSSRMAYLLAKEINETIDEHLLTEIREKGLTILGYEMYSELLLSMLKGMLGKLWGIDEGKLNHNLYEDGLELRLIKKAEIKPNVIIVVPIATTFSTAPKIENQLRIGEPGEYKVLGPLYNVLYVSNGNSEEQSKKLEDKFGWEEKNPVERLIMTKSIYDSDTDSKRKQRYLLSIPSKWYDIKECPLCYPKKGKEKNEEEDLLLEKPLFETDKTKVTPVVIFGLPKGREFDEQDVKRTYVLSEDMLYYGYHKRNHAHFLSAIDSERFLQVNEQKVIEWLRELRKTLIEKKGYRETDKVILISPSHYSNAKFTEMVNEGLFEGSGNIVHYDSSNEYIQNFDLIYGKEIKEAKWVFFVDDSLKSGSAFNKIFRFIESVIPKTSKTDKSVEKKPIDGVIILLNKSQPHVWKHINNLLSSEPDNPDDLEPEKPIFSGFANLHFYNAIKDYEHPPILLEKRRYDELRKSSSLDVLKMRFAEKVKKIKDVDTNVADRQRSTEKKQKQRLLVIASHKIVEYFTQVDKPLLSSGFYDFMNHLIEQQNNQIDSYVIPKKIGDMKDDFSKSFLKALTQLPFNQYKPLRDVVFKWTLELLEESMDDITKALQKGEFKYQQFETLKFLMRRACLLNSNALISTKFLEFLVKLYGDSGIPGMVTSKSSKEEGNTQSLKEVKSLKTFFIYYILQVKELLHKNEYRGLVLESNLNKIGDTEKDFIKQLVRILRTENVAFIQAYRYLRQLNEWGALYTNGNSKEIDYSNKSLVKLFAGKSIVNNHPRYLALNEYFKVTGQPQNKVKNEKEEENDKEVLVEKNEVFLNFLWLEEFFEYEHKKEVPLSEKTEHVFSKLFAMFNSKGIEQLGAFFLVLDNRDLDSEDLFKPFVAFNKEYRGPRGIDLYHFSHEKNAYLKDFLVGNDSLNEASNYRKTITELELEGQGIWKNLYQTKFTKDEKTNELDLKLLPGAENGKYNRLLLIKISKPEGTDNTKLRSQGLLGFYYHQDGKELLSPYLVQYLLLLRNSLSDFISRHHENDEFRDWKIANIKQRTSLLTGHGRETLMRIAANHPDLGRIVETLLLVQRFVIDKRDERKIIGEGRSQISEIFTRYFASRIGKSMVDKKFIEEKIKPMAETIFEMEEIENYEKVRVKVQDIPDDFKFNFDKEILQMICFELFVNAKKNRWIFIEDEEEQRFLGERFTQNIVWIDTKLNGKDLELTISNTGPTYEFDKRGLNEGQIKDKESTSGIELIRALLAEFDMGRLSFLKAEKINDEIHFGKISVRLYLHGTETEKSEDGR